MSPCEKSGAWLLRLSGKLFWIPLGYLLVAATPVIQDISPLLGPPGTEVVVQGQHLVSGPPAQTKVSLGTKIQPDYVALPFQVRFRVAAGSATGKIRITTPGGTAISTQDFEVVDADSDPEGAYTFGELNGVHAAKVEPSLLNQEAWIGIFRARWAPQRDTFGAALGQITTAFQGMNEFWKEATFGRTSFTQLDLSNAIVSLPKSNDFYYHPFRQREIRGTSVPDTITFPDTRAVTILSDGQNVSVQFGPGNWTPAAIKAKIDSAIQAAIPADPLPTFQFNQALATHSFIVQTTVAGDDKARLELKGSAIPFLGFGASSLYSIGSDTPAVIIFGIPISDTPVTFPTRVSLVVSTQGETTEAFFDTGSSFSADQIMTQIQAAYPGAGKQQPFTVEVRTAPLDPTRRFLVFKTHIAPDGDHGIRLTIGGTARDTLGLNGAGLLQRYEPEQFKGRNVILDGFNAHAATLPAGTDVNALLGNSRMFVGIMVDNNSLRAHHSEANFEVLGEQFERNFFVARRNSLGPFAHEVGHALGLPDLYKYDNWQVGNPPNNWDIMDCSSCDAHPVGWLKVQHHLEPENRVGHWIDEPRVVQIQPPPPGQNRVDRFLLTPVESPWILNNPFAAAHPGVPVVHGIELVPTDPKDVVFIENRQMGPYQAPHLGDTVDFSTSIPNEGVIIYGGRRLGPAQGVAYVPVNLLSIYADPLNSIGESYSYVFTNVNKATTTIIDRIPNPNPVAGILSYSYLVEVRWGEGSFYDAAINPWNPPPWESADIWVDNAVENGWGVYSHHDDTGNPILNGDNIALNQANRLHARIHNLGDVPITQPVEVKWRIRVPQIAGGPIESELGSVIIPGGIPGESFVITPPLDYRPVNDNAKHVCIRAEILTVPGELNGTLNNMAQENLTQWYSGAGSPFSPVIFPIITVNPYKNRSIDVVLHVPDVPNGWTVSVEDVAFRLPPGGTKKQNITIRPYFGYFQKIAGVTRMLPPEPFSAHIEARMPFGDNWIPFGGVTAGVHPVNKITTIILDPRPLRPRTGGVFLTGKVTSPGPLDVTFAGRDIDVRFDFGSRSPIWVRVNSNARGQFIVPVPPKLFRRSNVNIQVFVGGGKGLMPARSRRGTMTIPNSQIPIVGTFTPVIPTLSGDTLPVVTPVSGSGITIPTIMVPR